MEPMSPAIPSEYMSNAGLDADDTSQYHIELIEEKREQIGRIVQKRHRKATLAQYAATSQHDPLENIKIAAQE